MVAALGKADTLFSVLVEAARRRSQRSLALQSAIAFVTAVLFAIRVPSVWPVVALALSVSAYGVWGLLDRGAERRVSRRALLVMLATLGTVSAMVGLIGFALGAFTGTGKSPYEPCGPGASSRYCQAQRHPQPVSKLPIP